MKFGKRIAQEQLQHAPLGGNYVRYKALKGVIKRLRAAQQAATGPLAEGWQQQFLDELAADAQLVDRTFAGAVEALGGEVASMMARVEEETAAAGGGLPSDHPLVALCDGLCTRLNELRGYVLLNFIAFAKIAKKFDKKCHQSFSRSVMSAVRSRDFYRSDSLARLVTQAECAAGMISGVTPRVEDYSCGICLNLLCNPVVLSCVHRFCWSCLARAAQFGVSCPLCRKEMPLDPRNYQIESTLHKFVSRHFPQSAASRDDEDDDDDDDDGDDDDDDNDGDLASERGLSCPSATLVVARNSNNGGSDDDDDDMVDCSLSRTAAIQSSTPASAESRCSPVCVSSQPVAGDGDVACGCVSCPPAPRPLPYPVRIGRLGDILRHAHAGTVVALDLDETLVMSPAPSSLFTPYGVGVFQNLVRSFPATDANKAIVARFQSVLDEKVPVESSTLDVVRKLQQRGCWVLGLTARYFSTAALTQAMLARLGIDLTVGQPGHLPVGDGLQDPETTAVFAGGVIYTNATDKGVVLNRYLYHVVGVGVRDDVRVPREFVFVDDRHSNCESVLAGLSVAAQLSVPVHAYHYTGAEVPFQRPQQEPYFEEMVSEQFAHFFETDGQILSDEDACARIAVRRAHGCSIN